MVSSSGLAVATHLASTSDHWRSFPAVASAAGCTAAFACSRRSCLLAAEASGRLQSAKLTLQCHLVWLLRRFPCLPASVPFDLFLLFSFQLLFGRE